MKKYLLALAVLATGLAASASVFSPAASRQLHPELRGDIVMAQAKAPATLQSVRNAVSRADDTVDYTLAGNPYTAFGLNGQTTGMQLAAAFQIVPEFLSGLTDAKITAINFYTGTQGDLGVNLVKKATVFITDDLTKSSFLYTQVVDLPETAFTKVNVTLNEAFAIPADSEIYVGMYCSVADEDTYPLVIDYQGHSSDYGGWLAYRQNSSAKFSWQNISSTYGFVNVGCTISASNLPKNCVSVDAMSGQPVSEAGASFDFFFRATNQGVNNIETLKIEYGIDGEPTVSDELSVSGGNWNINQSMVASIENFVANNPTKASNVTLKITEVNGQPNTASENSASYSMTIVPVGTDLPRNIVVEEFTSIGCPYCPVGYTGMEMLREEANDGRIIPVSVHTNFNGKTDPMTSSSYLPVLNRYASGYPSSVINRTYSVYPYFEDMMETATEVMALPGVAHVEATASLDKENRLLTVNTNTSYAFDYTDGDANFILSYGITEDEMGPYAQLNGYSGASYTVPGDWQDQASSVNLVFNDIARQLDRYSGITGSVPAEIKRGEKYAYTHQMTLLQSINMEKMHLVVYLLNRKTGAVENSCTLDTFEPAAIDDVMVDSDFDASAPVEYFNLQGVRVTNPGNGLFIRRQGNKAAKVVL